jgi:hypothetical protein
MPRKRTLTPEPVPAPPQGSAWLTDLAQQLDSVIDEDPKKRSAGTLVVRALIREALKGNVQAIRECLSLAQRHQSASPSPAQTRRRGRPSVKVDLDEVRRLARMGMRDVSKIAHCMGVPKQTLLGRKHGEPVKLAFEEGRSFFELDALNEYAEDIRNNRRNPLVIFKMKQCGWTDKEKQEVTGKDGEPFTFTLKLDDRERDV